MKVESTWKTYNKLARAVACPQCGAEIAHRCVGGRGTAINGTHYARRDAAKKLRAAARYAAFDQRLSPAQRHVLRNIAAGRLARDGLSGRSAMGGLENTIAALVRRGLIGWDHQLTDAGRKAVDTAATT